MSNLTLFKNSSLPSNSSNSILIDPGPIYNSYSIGYFFIGFAITISASILNAFAINLQKLDLNRSTSSPQISKKPDCLRPLWLLGLLLYVSSQVLGSTLALQYMRSEYVAPLGSASLIFNFLFARWLLGTEITLLDAFGTLVVIIGVVGVIGFSNIRQAGIDEEANMSLSTLKALWARRAWIVHLLALELVTMLVLWLASIGSEIIDEKTAVEGPPPAGDDELAAEMVLRRGGGRMAGPARPLPSALAPLLAPLLASKHSLRRWLKTAIERWSVSRPEQTLLKLVGLLWGCSAGLLAGQTLVFAKSFVKLVSNGFGHQAMGQPKDLGHPLSILILVLLLLTGILQVWCLNRGLKVYDSTLIVPVLFATYTASGFINSLIYLNELPHYRSWVLLMIWLCIAVLVMGVWMLSAKRPETVGRPQMLGDYSSAADPEGEVQQTAIGREELVGMVMIGSEIGNGGVKRRAGSGIHTRSQSPSGSTLNNTDEHPTQRPSVKLGTEPVVPGSHKTSSVSGRVMRNPFEEFELVNDEEVEEEEEEESEDEIDGLEESSNHGNGGYFEQEGGVGGGGHTGLVERRSSSLINNQDHLQPHQQVPHWDRWK